MQGIFQTEFERVQAKVPGHFFHMAFDRPKTLGNTVTSEGARWSMVGVNDIGIKADIG